jgi:hypothetical protein
MTGCVWFGFPVLWGKGFSEQKFRVLTPERQRQRKNRRSHTMVCEGRFTKREARKGNLD